MGLTLFPNRRRSSPPGLFLPDFSVSPNPSFRRPLFLMVNFRIVLLTVVGLGQRRNELRPFDVGFSRSGPDGPHLERLSRSEA